MERDFMGLNSARDSVVVMKEEAVEGCKESDGFEASKIRQAAEIQKSVGGTHYSTAAYPMQPIPFSMQLINGSKQTVPISMNHPFFRAQFGGAPVKPHGSSVPSIGSFLAGTTEPWYSSKTSCAPPQLTIFYGGMVNVYDDISPEKAQAIMFLAGNGACANTPQPRVPSQVPVSQPCNAQPCSAMSSPISVSSHPTVGPTNKDEVAKIDTPKRVVNSLEQVLQSAVPQARKASLARFLEKRKERVMALAPYNVAKDSIANPGPNSMNAVAASEH